jgi:hypothetical protein
LPDETNEPVDYDTEALIGVLQMIVTEYGNLPLTEVWQMIDWDALRRHDEPRAAYQARMVELSALRGVTVD